MKKNIICFFLTIELGIIIIAGIRYLSPPNSNLTGPNISKVTYDSAKPPSLSLIGNVISSAGEINWQSREATQSSLVRNLTQVKQGEKIKTSKTGTISIQFKNQAEVIISGNSELNLTQTLPLNLVFSQTSGTVLYNSFNNSPLSVRSLHLLSDQKDGQMSVTVETETSKVIVKALSGDILLGYNDTDLKSQTFTLLKSREAIFDDKKRTLIIKNI